VRSLVIASRHDRYAGDDAVPPSRDGSRGSGFVTFGLEVKPLDYLPRAGLFWFGFRAYLGFMQDFGFPTRSDADSGSRAFLGLAV